jgi:serine/threonine-protein kinase
MYPPMMTMIDPRYQLLEPIAKSDRSTVFRARDLQEQRDVVIKRPAAQILPGDSFREGDALAQIRHPHIITLEHVGSDEDGPYLVLEMLLGETLDTRIQKAALSIEEVMTVARQTLQALQAVHEAGFIHRDVKPENLMLLPLEDGAFHVKLFDFDLAHPLGATPADTATGSVYFMAPEQFKKKRPDVRTDLYALGAILHFALTQRYPFEGENKAQVITAHLYHDCIPLSLLRPDAPEPLVEWLTQLVSLSPAQRPASAAEALAQLESLASLA